MYKISTCLSISHFRLIYIRLVMYKPLSIYYQRQRRYVKSGGGGGHEVHSLLAIT